MCNIDLYGNSLSGGRPGKEPPRVCWHCNTDEEDGAKLWEAHCSQGQGLLHCEECSGRCEKCQERFCVWDLKFKEDGETVLLMCEECRGTNNEENTSPR